MNENWKSSKYRNRIGWTYTSNSFRTTILQGGGHIAELTMLNTKHGDINPLWSVPWDTIEPQDYHKYADSGKYEDPPFGQVHASIMGHNICLDGFGVPSKSEQENGLGIHGEAPVAIWNQINAQRNYLEVEAELPKANMSINRKISTRPDSPVIQVIEKISNKNAFDYPTIHVQHPTIGPPFLDTQFSIIDLPSSQSIVCPDDLGGPRLLKPGIHFKWPNAPLENGNIFNLRYPLNPSPVIDLTTHLLSQNPAWFTVINTKLNLGLVYMWDQKDFPWLIMWDENKSRKLPPWNGKGHTRGMEFGNTALGGPKKQLLIQGKVLNTPTYRWVDATSSYQVVFLAALFSVPSTTTGTEYCAIEDNIISIKLINGPEIKIPAFELDIKN